MRLKSFLIMLLGVFLAGCGASPPPPAFRLIEKGPYQALYGADGRLQRLVYDADGDGVVDRWEYFDLAGRLQKVGFSRDKSGRPGEWDWVDASGAVVRRELAEGDRP